MSSSNCCFLACIQVSQEAGQVVWYSHLFQNFPQFFVIHTIKGFGIVNKAEVDVFVELSCFIDDPTEMAIWPPIRLPFLKPACTSGFIVHVLLKPDLENFEPYFTSTWDDVTPKSWNLPMTTRELIADAKQESVYYQAWAGAPTDTDTVAIGRSPRFWVTLLI